MRNLNISSDLNYDVYNTYMFDSNFKHIKDDSYLYIDFGNLSSDFYHDDFFEITETDINKLKVCIVKTDIYPATGDLKSMSLTDLIEIIKDEFSNDNYYSLSDKEAIYQEYNIAYKKNYEVMYIRGYNQGDEVQILINKDEFKKVAGVEFNARKHEDTFTNYIYDSEIYGDITITFDYTTKGGINHTFNEVFNFNEVSNNCYEINLNIENILNIINFSLIGYELSNEQKEAITTELLKLDYTDITYPKCS
ncbi:hypothetical protein TPMD03_6 [Thiohalocapsa phage LS06-2018-MD03]|nr:hypothetical protein TPMD03_6 [Thiohalocapsa phage LS06-2018-MD03]